MTSEELRKAVLDDKGLTKTIEFGGKSIEVREPTAGDKAQYFDFLNSIKGDGTDIDEEIRSGRIKQVVVSESLARLAVKCVYNPDDGTRIFSDEQWADLMAGRRLAKLINEAVLELLKAGREQAGKESEETPTSADGSSSQKQQAAA